MTVNDLHSRAYQSRLNKVFLMTVMVLFTIAAVNTLSWLSDRASHQMSFRIAEFTEDGYILESTHPDGPFIAGEDIEITLKESNTKAKAIDSAITMSIAWTSPDISIDATDGMTVTLADGTETEEIASQPNENGGITFTLPSHTLTSGTLDDTRSIQLHIPETLKSTGTISVTFDKVILQQSPGGFSTVLDNSQLNKGETPHDFSVNVGWAASASTDALDVNAHKALMGYLTDDAEGIRFQFEFGYLESGIKDFDSASASKWSHYKEQITSIVFPDSGKITSIGDYSFTDFTQIIDLTLPSDLTSIGAYTFDSISIPELTIPEKVTTLGAMSFGHIDELEKIFFEASANTSLSFPTSGSDTGAFYVPSHLDTIVVSENQLVREYVWSDDNRNVLFGPGIFITNPPDKTEYVAGEDFNKEGMEVTLIDSNGNKQVITDYTVTNGDNLDSAQTSITVSYSDGNNTYTAATDITVIVPQSLTIKTPPAKTDYKAGESFDPADMVITVTYSNGKTKDITSDQFTVVNGNNLTVDQASVAISYTEGGVTLEIEQEISVTNPSFVWKKYLAEPITTYYWDKYNRNSTTTYYWNKYNRNSTTTYYWNKYNRNSTTTYYWEKYNYNTTTNYQWDKYSLMYEYDKKPSPGILNVPANKYVTLFSNFDPSTWTFSGGVSVLLTIDNVETYAGYYYKYSSEKVYYLKEYNTTQTTITNNAAYSGDVYRKGDATKGTTSSGTVSSTSITAYPVNGISGSYWYVRRSGTVDTYSKGSTSYGQVSSTSSSAYPDNGKSGDYWYVYSTSSTSYSKGSTSYGQVSSTSSTAYPDNGYSGSYWYVYSSSSISYSKGSTSYGQVSSTSSTAYPDNGYSGSYWYVYSSSSTSYSKGSTSYGQVSSTSSTAYPTNSYSGSYWYVYNGAETNYSQGNYVEDVTSTNQNEYPDNGRHTDGYWYVKVVDTSSVSTEFDVFADDLVLTVSREE